MESLTQTVLLKFNSNTLHNIRKEFNCDKNMNENIDILEAWLQKQDHFVRKVFPRNYLERIIVFNKGSVERAKSKLDKLCTTRSAYPYFFDVSDLKERFTFPELVDGLLPQMTLKDERIYLLKTTGEKFERGLFHYYKFLLSIVEYAYTNDYNRGIIIVLDYTEVNIYELFKALNVSDLKTILTIITEAYGMRLKEMHIISNNKAIEMIVGLIKQVVSAKLIARLFVHKSIDTLDTHFPRHILPVEYGGTEKCMKTIFENNFNEITSERFLKYLKEMSEAGVNEEYRQRDNPNSDVMGVAGTFRTLNID